MKLLFGALFLLIVAGIFVGTVSYLAEIITEMGIASLNLVPLDFPH